jgi:hypothetical protein
MADMNTDDIRGRIQQVLDNARNDPQFWEQFKGDPEGTFKNAGVDADMAHYIVNQELNFSGDDVGGFLKCTFTCDRYSCLATWCGYVPYSN